MLKIPSLNWPINWPINWAILAFLLFPPSAESHGLNENDYVAEESTPDLSSLAPDPEALPRPGETQDDVDRRLGPWLNLRDGGYAVGPSQGKVVTNPDGTTSGSYGALEHGSLLPAKGEGFERRGGDEGHYGAGHMISLLVRASAEFSRSHPGNLARIGSIAKQLGGNFPTHKSHQNGLDADISFLGQSKYESVLDDQGNVTEKFQPEKNWEYWRQLTAQRFAENGRVKSIVALILVAPEIKKFMCAWAKEKNLLNDPLSREVLQRLHPTAGHDDHFHLRLHCSPYHTQCVKNFGPRAEIGC